MPDLLGAALFYAEQMGWAVIPLHTPNSDGKCSCGVATCHSAGKHPRTRRGSHDASSDKVQIIEWWRKWPDANVGIATGETNDLLVIDVDPKNGGDKTFKELVKQHGSTWTKTLTDTTGSGGQHLYYKSTTAPLIKSPKGIDFRSKGALVVAPPSLHASGNHYTWDIVPSVDAKIRPAPKWAQTTIVKKRQEKAKTTAAVWRNGERNTNMASFAGKWQRQGALEPVIMTACLTQNRLVCDPPLDEREVEIIVHSITRYNPTTDVLGISDGQASLDYADEDNAKRLVALHGNSIVFTDGVGWLTWDSTNWQRDAKNTAMLGKAFGISKVIREEAEHASDDREHKRLLLEAKRAGMSRNASDTIKAASAISEMKIKDSRLDGNPWLFNVRNGTIDLRTGRLRPHDKDDYITKLAPVTYAKAATAPRFAQFLQETFEDAELIAFMQRLLGYCLTGDVSEQVFVIFWGIGGNGKSKLVEDVMRHIMGDDYATQISGNAITDAKFANQTATANAKLLGKRFATSSESGARKRLDEENIKRITGGDSINAKFLYRDEFEFKPTHKVILITNHKPRVSASPSMARRLLLIPFEHVPAVIDKKLGEKLQAESSGILNWLIKGCLEWQRIGLKPPRIVRLATKEFQEEYDYIGQFIKEMCVMSATRNVAINAFYDSYSRWCRAVGVIPMGKVNVGTAVFERFNGLEKYRSHGIRRWRGVGMRKNNDSSK